MSISAQVQSKVTVTETLTGDDLNANSTLLHNGYDDDHTFTSSTSIDATKAAFQTVAMTAGAATIDLTSLLLNGAAVTLTGLNLRTIKIKALAANGADITVAKGASNGYTGLGSSFSTTLKPGEAVQFTWTLDNSTAVGGSVKTLDLSGTGTDGVQLSVVAGT